MKRILLTIMLALLGFQAFAVRHGSFYTSKPEDPDAICFTPGEFNITNNGRTDVSEELQRAINRVKIEKGYGVLFVPEGKYRISRTIYIPSAVRVIGYGRTRPEFILTRNSPGFQEEPDDKGKARYMFWFTGGLVKDENHIPNANAGTFYSCLSNVNIRIEDGNPYAVALQTHYAQHSYVSHISMDIGKGKAGIFDCGNEMEDIAFYGGEYGIYTTKSSPGWPVMAVDLYFEGQRKAALYCQESGLAIVNLQVRKVPAVFEIQENYADRISVENAWIEDVPGPMVSIANEDNSNTQINFQNVYARNAPWIAKFVRSGKQTRVTDRVYRINSFSHGLQMEDMLSDAEYVTGLDWEPVAKIPPAPSSVLPDIPDMSQWVNLRDFGAVGDGLTDDTDAIQAAIDSHDVIYVPSGEYIVSRTIRMHPHTRLIGLHPFATQFKILESTPAFSSFGPPVAVLESSRGGDNILTGIGINTGAYNYRAVGLKWMAGEHSYVNDVKFVGGHGTLRRPAPQNNGSDGRGWEPRISSPEHPVYAGGKDLAWDRQYWSLWITDNGGGFFKDIWTASSYATDGVYVENTCTPGNVFAMSVEHHVFNEVRLNKVQNWKFYCLQTEEESVESTECQPIEMDDCDNVAFHNTYMFRVIRVNEPYNSSIRVRNCRDIRFYNLHNFSQIKYTTSIPVFDQNKNIEVRPWELAKLVITGKEESRRPVYGNVTEVAHDFDFAEGIASDSKGNVYFCDFRQHRIFRIDAVTGNLSLVADFHWKPQCIAFDTRDNLLVLFRYDPQPGYAKDPLKAVVLPDAGGTSFSGWGNSGFMSLVYVMDPGNPEETVRLLELVPMSRVESVDKAFYASNRWRDYHDFNEAAVFVPEKCFMAPDGRTIIPQQYDLARTSSLVPAIPGRTFYTSDEYDRRIVSAEVADNGTLSNLKYHVEFGEFGLTTDADGRLYVADGDILIFDKDGKRIGIIHIPERPSTITFGGSDGNTLFVTGRKNVYSIVVE